MERHYQGKQQNQNKTVLERIQDVNVKPKLSLVAENIPDNSVASTVAFDKIGAKSLTKIKSQSALFSKQRS